MKRRYYYSKNGESTAPPSTAAVCICVLHLFPYFFKKNVH